MTRIAFDQFCKEFLEEFLSPLGSTQKSLEVPGESRFVDIWFVPAAQPAIDPAAIGLLGKIAASPCLIEPFRNPPTATEIRNCLLKLFLVQADLQRKAKRDDRRLLEDELPLLWILATSASDSLLGGFRTELRQDWGEGVYFLAASLKAAIVAINQLPVTPETLWLRVLGKGRIQQQAIREVIALPPDEPKRSMILRLLVNWRIIIETSEEVDEDDRETFMALSSAYLEWEQQTQQRGIEQGIQTERRNTIETLLNARFGELDPALAAIVPVLIALPPEEYTQLLLQLPMLSSGEILSRFRTPD